MSVNVACKPKVDEVTDLLALVRLRVQKASLFLKCHLLIPKRMSVALKIDLLSHPINFSLNLQVVNFQAQQLVLRKISKHEWLIKLNDVFIMK